MLDKTKFMQTFTCLCDIYGKIPSEIMLDMYYKCFEDYTAEEFSCAVTKCIKERVYNSLPKPAEILSFLEGTKDDKALIAWMKAKEAVKKVGYYMTPEFDDSIISHCLIELGGWMEFCSAKIEDSPFIEKRFMDLYRLFLKRGVDSPQRLIGFIDLKNIEKGYPEQQKIKLISESLDKKIT